MHKPPKIQGDTNWTNEHITVNTSNNITSHSCCPKWLKVTNQHMIAHKVQHMNQGKNNEHIRYALHTYSWEYLTQVDIGHYKQWDNKLP